MREIKFRAWGKEERHMHHNWHLKNHLEEWLNEDGYIVMQYTGLKDKNGKEIFEGDIVRRSDKMIYGVVEYKDHMFYMNGIDDQDDYFNHTKNYYEIVGNIYENPELLAH